MDTDIPYCDICEQREATSCEDGVYRCEYCETAHQRHDAAEEALGVAQARSHLAVADPDFDEPEPSEADEAESVVDNFDSAA